MVAKNHTLNVSKPCAKCGTVFKPFGETKNRVSKYCSKSCWSVRKHSPRGCLTCGVSVRNPKKYCGMDCRNKAYVGKFASDATRQKMSDAKEGYMPVNVFKPKEQHPNWIADRSQVNRRWWPENKTWRMAVLKRDNYQCQMCSVRSTRGNRVVFDVDHIKPWSKFPDLRFEISNGRTLCRPCHMKTDTWLGKARWGKTAVLLTGEKQDA